MSKGYLIQSKGKSQIIFVTQGQDQNQVQIKVYNSQGIEVTKLIDQPFVKGNYEVKWLPTKADGLYFIRMRIGQYETKAMKVIIN